MKNFKTLALIGSLIFGSNFAFAQNGKELFKEAIISIAKKSELSQVIEKLTASCNASYADACYVLAEGYQDGKIFGGSFQIQGHTDGFKVQKDTEKAIQFFKKTCEANTVSEDMKEEACKKDTKLKYEMWSIAEELSKAKDSIDEALMDGKEPVLEIKVQNTEEKEPLGLLNEKGEPISAYLKKVEFTGKIQEAGNGSIKATIGKKADKSIHGVEIEHNRNGETGVWTCYVNPSKATGWTNDLLPKGCTIKK